MLTRKKCIFRVFKLMLSEAFCLHSEHSCACGELYEVPGGNLVDGLPPAPSCAARGARTRERARPRDEDPGLERGPEQVGKRLRPEQVVKLLQGGKRLPYPRETSFPGGKQLGGESLRAGPGASALRTRDPAP